MPTDPQAGADPTAVTDRRDAELARAIARRCGEELMALRRQSPESDRKTLGERGDRLSHHLIVAALADSRPQDALLSEEATADPARLGASRVWIVDPLDGTREYSEGRSDFAVHIALVVDGRPVVGAVAMPAEELVWSSDEPPVVPPRSDRRVRMVVSRTRPPAEAPVVADRLDADVVPLGSAGAKTMAVVRGDAEIYLHAGGQYEWDSAAPVAVAVSAGLHASRLDGTELRYNQPDPWLPDLLVCRRELVADVRLALSTSR